MGQGERTSMLALGIKTMCIKQAAPIILGHRMEPASQCAVPNRDMAGGFGLHVFYPFIHVKPQLQSV